MEIKNYPKSKDKLKIFIKDILKDLQQDVAKKLSFEEGFIMPEIDDDMLESYIPILEKGNVRTLYDFFDKNDIYISIRNAGKNNFYFSWNVKYEKGINPEHEDASGNSSPSSFRTRAECEEAGFNFCFKLMEGKL